MIEEAVALFALPPGEFVAERNRLVKLLKAAGRVDDSAAVSALKRPKLSEYALNRLAHEHLPIIERLIEAIEQAADAQSAAIGGQAGGLREATAELRAATKLAADSAVQLLNGDGANGEGQRDEIVALIRDFVGSGEVDALRFGVVGASGSDGAGGIGGGDDFFRGAPDPPTSTVTRAKKPVRQPAAPKAPPPLVGPSPADRARRIQLERQLRDAVSQVERAERTVAEAEELLRQAQAKLDERLAVLDARKILVTEAEAELATFNNG